MKKSSSAKVASPVHLGVKRACPKCSTKFYDFGKTQISCPKCKTEINVENISMIVPKTEPPKRSVKAKEMPENVLMEQEDTVGAADSEFESLEDLEEDDDLVDDLEVGEEEEA